ncbi:glutamate-1-semialdehyde-2,1-aminomutase [Orenia metallireducens]|uniref:Glutamate-1-semialdehyde 2,1-aminomutase n=1 Tax=Orenia metallireducens TaxID=1413210 RepID=A0A1C0A7C4_9FIRM|nr:glutamate-1-semialdehyde 2,1-aminomutase [Orenia metallireducens]OCL26153.1 glutamate-1-semialdehyde-2,1-aminomutase [Orenia metallireducens]
MSKSKELFSEAKKYIPGGVNSPARAFKAVENDPLFIEQGKGAFIYDVDGKKYIDYVGSWGPMILGHNHPAVVEALQQQLMKGSSFGAPTKLETILAEMVVEGVSSVDKVRMVNSGTEATMSALRLARGYTGRTKIIKMEGCYHGHGDSLLVEAGSGITTLGIAGSAGVPAKMAEETIVVPYNDISALEEVFKEYSQDVAAVILEPVTGNMGVVAPKNGYLESLREITKKYGTLLIFDEVMTGFRLAYGGAQELYQVEPDLTTFGKIIGGGLPVGAYGGKREIMNYIAPEGPVYQAGTLSGNPLAMTAGISTLKLLKEEGVYNTLEEKGKLLEAGIQENIRKVDIPVVFSRIGSMFTLFFNGSDVTDYQSAKGSNTKAFSIYFNKMLEEGIYLPPSQFEANFISLTHSKDEIEATVEANYKALLEVKEKAKL